MNQLVLKKVSDFTVLATFTFDMKIKGDSSVEDMKSLIKGKFGHNVYIRFEQTDIKGNPPNIRLTATFGGISVNEIKEALEQEFPVTVVIGG